MLKLTGPLLVLILTAVFLFLAATNIQGGWLYLVDALLWAVVFVALVVPFLQMRKLSIRRFFSAEPTVGQTLQVELEVHSTGRWPVSFVNIEDLPPVALRTGLPAELQDNKGFILQLTSQQPFQHSYGFVPASAGVYVFSRLRTGSFGPLGLLGVYWQQTQAGAVVVLPAAPEHSLKLFNADQQRQLEQARRRSLMNDDISHFRPYQPGDSKRMIHWKNTARQQQLIVAEAREEPFQRVMLFFDTHRDVPRELFARMIFTAEQVCFALLQQHLTLDCWAQPADPLYWEKLGLPAPARQLQGADHWEKLRYWLATLMPDASMPLDSRLRTSGAISSSELMVIISPQLPDALFEELSRFKTPELPVMLYAESGPELPAALRCLVNFRPLL